MLGRPKLPAPAPQDEEFAASLTAIRKMQEERDSLLAESHDLRTRLETAERETAFLRQQLTTAERKRDMYQRHAVSLYTRIVDLVPSIRGFADALQKALHDAHAEAQSGGAEPQPIAATDEARLRDLAARLAAHTPEEERQ